MMSIVICVYIIQLLLVPFFKEEIIKLPVLHQNVFAGEKWEYRNKTNQRDQKARRNKKEDLQLKLELQQSSKDRSELLMIVDLERNDLNHVCEPGSVIVTEHFAVETYATVFHLVTTIIGKMKKTLKAIDLIKATFPGGSITGAPKIRAMEIIDELEHDRRNLYTGSIGYFSFNGDCDFNIVIRTAVYQNDTYYIGVGGGITCESDQNLNMKKPCRKQRLFWKLLVMNNDKSFYTVFPPLEKGHLHINT